MRTSLCVLLALALSGCSTSEAPKLESTSATETTDSATSVEPSDVLIIDVRSKEEWDSGHLNQAVHIPHTEIAAKIGDHALSKDAKIVLYCKSGGRAGKAKETLEELGFIDVENAGGYDDIKQRFQ